MTFLRYSRDLWADTPAKMANPAKAERNQDVTTDKARLKPAKVHDAGTDFSPTLATLSPPKSAENLSFGRFIHFSQTRDEDGKPPKRNVLVGEWKVGVETLLSMSRPRRYPSGEWAFLLDDADRLMKRWAAQAADLGWQSWEIWGVSRVAPRYRFDAMGLVPILKGARIAAITADAAVIQTRTSNLLRFYRRTSDPLNASERALIWELT